MKQLIYVILLSILLSTACNSSKETDISKILQDDKQAEELKEINIRKILQDNRQTEELEAQFFDV